jgi:hypothetical protein
MDRITVAHIEKAIIHLEADERIQVTPDGMYHYGGMSVKSFGSTPEVFIDGKKVSFESVLVKVDKVKDDDDQ